MDDLEPKTAAIEVRLEELLQVLASTNEKLDKVLAGMGSARALVIETQPFFENGKLYQALRMKPVQLLTSGEIAELNKHATDRQRNKRAQSTDAIKRPTYEQIYSPLERLKDRGVQQGLGAIVKNLIIKSVTGFRANIDEEVTKEHIEKFLDLGRP